MGGGMKRFHHYVAKKILDKHGIEWGFGGKLIEPRIELIWCKGKLRREFRRELG
jgi:hypothetical protein